MQKSKYTKRSAGSTIFRENKQGNRFVEIGWQHNADGKYYKQVRTKHGGGSRKVRLPKTYTKKEIIEEGKKNFFLMENPGMQLCP